MKCSPSDMKNRWSLKNFWNFDILISCAKVVLWGSKVYFLTLKKVTIAHLIVIVPKGRSTPILLLSLPLPFPSFLQFAHLPHSCPTNRISICWSTFNVMVGRSPFPTGVVIEALPCGICSFQPIFERHTLSFFGSILRLYIVWIVSKIPFHSGASSPCSQEKMGQVKLFDSISHFLFVLWLLLWDVCWVPLLLYFIYINGH